MAMVAYWADADWTRSESESKRALALKPEPLRRPDSLTPFSLPVSGSTTKRSNKLKNQFSLIQVSFHAHVALVVYQLAGRLTDALAQNYKALELNRGCCLNQLGTGALHG
jgi:hypothetical protein